MYRDPFSKFSNISVGCNNNHLIFRYAYHVDQTIQYYIIIIIIVCISAFMCEIGVEFVSIFSARDCRQSIQISFSVEECFLVLAALHLKVFGISH